jgi:hypothetical protein
MGAPKKSIETNELAAQRLSAMRRQLSERHYVKCRSA